MLLRTFLLAALVLAAFSPVVSRAQTVIPHDVNIHNGVIEVRNHIQVYGYNGLEGASTRLNVGMIGEPRWKTHM